MTFSLVVPHSVEAVIQSFEALALPFTQLDVAQALSAARQSMNNPSEGENLGAWAEVLAFGLAPSRRQASPWGTYFGPMGSAETEDGKIAYFPDIAGVDTRVLDHWISRARTIAQPVLKARYADLAWDMASVIASTECGTTKLITWLASPSTLISPRCL
jgi:lysyl-tRNA synthetase, class I